MVSPDRLESGKVIFFLEVYNQPLPPCNVGVHQLQHVDGGFVQPDKHSIVDLTQSKQLQNLACARADTVDPGRRAQDSIREGKS